MRCRTFDMPYSFVNAVLWVNFYQQMHMVWHDFHFDYISLNLGADGLYQLL